MTCYIIYIIHVGPPFYLYSRSWQRHFCTGLPLAVWSGIQLRTRQDYWRGGVHCLFVMPQFFKPVIWTVCIWSSENKMKFNHLHSDSMALPKNTCGPGNVKDDWWKWLLGTQHPPIESVIAAQDLGTFVQKHTWKKMQTTTGWCFDFWGGKQKSSHLQLESVRWCRSRQWHLLLVAPG